MRLIDVSHTVEHGMVTYKGLPAPLICDYLSRERARSSSAWIGHCSGLRW